MDRNQKYEGAGPAVETENKGGESVEVDVRSESQALLHPQLCVFNLSMYEGIYLLNSCVHRMQVI